MEIVEMFLFFFFSFFLLFFVVVVVANLIRTLEAAKISQI